MDSCCRLCRFWTQSQRCTLNPPTVVVNPVAIAYAADPNANDWSYTPQATLTAWPITDPGDECAKWNNLHGHQLYEEWRKEEVWFDPTKPPATPPEPPTKP